MFKIDDVVLWLAGLLLTGGGLSAILSGSVLSGFFGVLAGIALLPPFHRLMYRKLNRNTPQIVFLAAAAVLFVVGKTIGGVDSGVAAILSNAEVNNTANTPAHQSENHTAATNLKQEGDDEMAQIRQKMHSAEKSAHAPLYNRHQANPILERIERSHADARAIFNWAISQAAQAPDCGEIFKAEINPDSTSSNIIVTVTCANRTSVAVNETEAPSNTI